MSKYPEYKQLQLPQISKDVLKFWEQNSIFQKSVSTREGKTPWVFYEGPPSANGMPGIHHVMARSIKDIFCRFKTLQGYQVKRKAGWDTHGLPIELGVEKSLGITKEDIGNKNSPKYISVEDYNKACRKEVMKYTDKWEDVTRMMGYWVDMKDPYITYDNKYIESVWWLLEKIHAKGLLYDGYTIQPYSPAAGTGLSSHELNQPGCYRNVKDRTAVVMFKIKHWEKYNKTGLTEEIKLKLEEVPTYFLAWTTTPWTLPSNTALAVSSKFEYLIVRTYDRYSNDKRQINVILAKDRIASYFNLPPNFSLTELQEGITVTSVADKIESGGKLNNFEILLKVNGSSLLGIYYEQLMPYVKWEIEDVGFKVIDGSFFITTEDGTGIVHIAPTFGADDMKAAQMASVPGMFGKNENNVPVPFVDLRGRFITEVTDFANEYVREEYLSEEEKLKEIERLKNLNGDSEFEQLIKNIVLKSNEYLNVNERIVLKLQLEGKLFKKENYEHNYPHCWRTDKPILYYPLDSWFIRVTNPVIKDRMVSLNKKIRWKPESTGTGRFGEWLNNIQDWNLSRSRFWGVPLPIWTYPSTDVRVCIGSSKDFHKDGILTYNDFIHQKNIHGKWLYKGEKFSALVDKILNEDPETEKNISEAQKKYWASTNNSIQYLKSIIKGNHDNLLWNLPHEFIEDYLETIPRDLDFHKPYVDNIVFFETKPYGDMGHPKIFTRENDLIDVWFDSGSMPFAQMHFPFENVREFSKNYPADFIAEGVDQTRGWFYTLHAISSLVKEEVHTELKKSNDKLTATELENLYPGIAYKNVVSNGLVLDKNGNKMSKRLGNAIDPFETIEKFGADATRWYMIANAAPWDNLKFDLEGISEVQRQLFGTLYNTYGFYALYANVDKFVVDEKNQVPLNKRTELDRWILSKLNSLIAEVTEHYETFEPHRAARSIEEFVDEHLSNWYVRLGRRRFWKGSMSDDKKAAYETLHECLLVVAQLMSPIAPFFGEWMYQNLREPLKGANSTSLTPESIHLTNFVTSDKSVIDLDLEQRMDLAQKISSMILSIRKKENLRVRQPLQKIQIPVLDKNIQSKIEAVKDLILAEVNVKEIEFVDESKTQIVKNLKLNFKTLGKKCGTHMKAVQAYALENANKIIKEIEQNSKYSINLNGTEIVLETEDVEIIPVDIPGWKVANNGALTVALDITLSAGLKQEGIARELVNRIQNLRKDKGLDVTDKILVRILQNSNLDTAIKNNLSYICSETLTGELQLVAALNKAEANEIEVDESTSTLISIEKLN